MAEPLFVETVAIDGMWRVPDDRAGDARRYRIAWFEPLFRPPLEEATQALGICFTGDHRIVLVTWNGEDWSLPGGSLEPGETLEQALACVVVLDGVGHFPYWEAPERLDQLLRTFLAPLTAEAPAALGRVAPRFVPEAGSVVEASPDAPGPRGRDDPTGSRQP